MDKKFGIALIALIGIGIFALPSTIALFSGQHSFYNIDATGNQVPCVKCHGDVKAELGSNADPGRTNSPGPHANFKCEYCHRAEAGFSAGDDAYAKIKYVNVTGPATIPAIYLATTVQNFERGNFPKVINYSTSINVDNWGTNCAGNCVFEWDGTTAFDDQDQFRISGNYSGSLMPTGDNGVTYKYDSSEELATSATPTGAFNPRGIPSWSTTTPSIVGSAVGAREVTPGTRYHAASLVSCMECHGGEQSKGVTGYEINTSKPYNHAGWVTGSACTDCHYGTGNNFERDLEAGGFGLTGFANDTGEVEAHKAFVEASSYSSGTSGAKILRSSTDNASYGASNIACVACHTHVAVDINFQKKYKVEFNAAGTGTGEWVVSGYGANGTVNISIFGNTEGDVWAVGDKNYSWTPDTTLYIGNDTNKQIGKLDNEANDSEAALISN